MRGKFDRLIPDDVAGSRMSHVAKLKTYILNGKCLSISCEDKVENART